MATDLLQWKVMTIYFHNTGMFINSLLLLRFQNKVQLYPLVDHKIVLANF